MVVEKSAAAHSPSRTRLREAVRKLLRLVGTRSSRDVEYEFAWRNIVGENLRILDVGGSDSLLPLILAKQGHSVTVYDFRSYTERHTNLTAIQGDFVNNDLPNRHFDYVTLISVIEHIGFGSYGTPRYKDGDIETIKQVQRVLTETGRAILTFPFAEREREIPGFERWYDVDRIKRLFEGMYVLAEEYWIPRLKVLDQWIKWVPATLEQAQSSPETTGCPSVACFVVSSRPLEHLSI